MNHRIVYSAGIRSPTLARTRTSGAVSISMSRLYWLYQPRKGLSFIVGRDDLPSGLTGLQSFSRRVNNPSVSQTPTQAKVFWWNDRWQVTAYGYGPDGIETDRQFRARGGGAVVGANVWRDRAVVGVTTRVSKADVFDRTNAGVFARWGITEKWGILAEHDVTQRTSGAGAEFTHLAGRSEVFYVPFDWLQTALSVDHVTTSGGDNSVRFSPSADIRLTSNIKLGFGVDHVQLPVESRTYSFELQVKTTVAVLVVAPRPRWPPLFSYRTRFLHALPRLSRWHLLSRFSQWPAQPSPAWASAYRAAKASPCDLRCQTECSALNR